MYKISVSRYFQYQFQHFQRIELDISVNTLDTLFHIERLQLNLPKLESEIKSICANFILNGKHKVQNIDVTLLLELLAHIFRHFQAKARLSYALLLEALGVFTENGELLQFQVSIDSNKIDFD